MKAMNFGGGRGFGVGNMRVTCKDHFVYMKTQIRILQGTLLFSPSWAGSFMSNPNVIS
jgi:hypothetical protein